jgi:hypothetical protein
MMKIASNLLAMVTGGWTAQPIPSRRLVADSTRSELAPATNAADSWTLVNSRRIALSASDHRPADHRQSIRDRDHDYGDD